MEKCGHSGQNKHATKHFHASEHPIIKPEQAVLDFCQTTYEAGANLAQWDRNLLER